MYAEWGASCIHFLLDFLPTPVEARSLVAFFLDISPKSVSSALGAGRVIERGGWLVYGRPAIASRVLETAISQELPGWLIMIGLLTLRTNHTK